MTRRPFLAVLSAFGLAPRLATAQPAAGAKVEPLKLSDAEWKQRLAPAAYDVLRHEGTEYPGSSPLNGEHRKGRFDCAGCDLPLFTSDTKFDSGTGWPSFYASIPGAVAMKTDLKMIVPRTEYHCVALRRPPGPRLRRRPEADRQALLQQRRRAQVRPAPSRSEQVRRSRKRPDGAPARAPPVDWAHALFHLCRRRRRTDRPTARSTRAIRWRARRRPSRASTPR